MATLEFVCAALGCSESESTFIDDLVDNCFPSFGDWEDSILEDFNPKYGRLCDYLIDMLYCEVISHYVELGLDVDKFDEDINSVCSGLIYDGEYVYEDDLEKLVEQLNNDNKDE